MNYLEEIYDFALSQFGCPRAKNVVDLEKKLLLQQIADYGTLYMRDTVTSVQNYVQTGLVNLTVNGKSLWLKVSGHVVWPYLKEAVVVVGSAVTITVLVWWVFSLAMGYYDRKKNEERLRRQQAENERNRAKRDEIRSGD